MISRDTSALDSSPTARHHSDSYPIALKSSLEPICTWARCKDVMWAFRKHGRPGREKGVRALNQPAQEIPTTKNARAVRRPLSLLPQPAVLRIRFSRAPSQFTTHLFHSPSTLLNFSESSLPFSLSPLHPPKSIRARNSLVR